jgi:hypothetical protein
MENIEPSKPTLKAGRIAQHIGRINTLRLPSN